MSRSAKGHRTTDRFSLLRRDHGGLLGIVILLVAVLVIFAAALATNQVFAFRDAAHFYYPLFQWTADQLRQGQLPLWNPLEDLGTPVVADATSSVFYPGKLMFLLPGPFGYWYKVYIVAHVFLCGVMSYRLARHWHAQASAATLAALSYALSGSVLFQYCNVVYLVGAAWLPAAIQSGDRLISAGGIRNLIALAVCLSMMVLGGDAQLAYHTGMMLVGLGWLSGRRQKSRSKRGFVRRLATLVVAALLAIGLAAVQWLPTAGWIASSTRASYDAPRNIYEFVRGRFATEQSSGFGQTLLGQVQTGHHQRAFDFSVGPWRAIELLWPNAGGTMFPLNRRWMNAIPAEGRVWSPTLYLGILPVLLASLSFRLRGGTKRRRFLSWCGLLSALAALGGYGFGWLLSEIHYGFGGDGKLPVGDPFGGLYWLFTIVLPGYVYFRYPAKLWVITSLVISQLAAISFGGLTQPTSILAQRLGRRLALAGGVTLTVGAKIWLVPLDWATWLAAAPVDRVLGPLDVNGVRPQLLISLGHTVAVLLALGTVLFLLEPKYRLRPNGRTSIAWLVVLITATELVVAHRNLVPLAAAETLTPVRSPRPGQTASAIGPVRFYRGLNSWYPAWDETPDGRLAKCLQWNNATMFPKLNLLQDSAVLPSRSSVTSVYQAELFAAVRKATDSRSLPVQFLRDLGVSCQLAPLPTGGEPQPVEPGRWQGSEIIGVGEEAMSAHFDERAASRVWIVRQIEWHPPVDPQHTSQLATFCSHLVQPQPVGLRDLQQSAVAESLTAPHPPTNNVAGAPGTPRPASDYAEITHYSEKRVDLATRLKAPGLVVINDTFAPGWHCYVKSSETSAVTRVPIHRTNVMMRGIHLPAGEFEIHMRYQPSDFFAGAMISGIAWIAVLLYLVVHFGFHVIRRLGAHA